MDHATALERLFEARQRIEELERGRGIAEEREACAKFIADWPDAVCRYWTEEFQAGVRWACEHLPAAIRARNASQG